MKKSNHLMFLALAFALAACNSGLPFGGSDNGDKPDAPAPDSTATTPTTPSECEKAATKCEALVDNDKERKLLECAAGSPCKSEIEARAVTDKAKCGEAKAQCLNDVACAKAKKAAAKACVDCDGKKPAKAKTHKVVKTEPGCPKAEGDAGKKGACVIDGVPNPTEAQCKTFAAEAAELDAAIKAGEDAADEEEPSGDDPL